MKSTLVQTLPFAIGFVGERARCALQLRDFERTAELRALHLRLIHLGNMLGRDDHPLMPQHIVEDLLQVVSLHRSSDSVDPSFAAFEPDVWNREGHDSSPDKFRGSLAASLELAVHQTESLMFAGRPEEASEYRVLARQIRRLNRSLGRGRPSEATSDWLESSGCMLGAAYLHAVAGRARFADLYEEAWVGETGLTRP